MRRRLAVGLAVAAVVVAGSLASRAEANRPDWAVCVPNAELACTTVDGIALGAFRQSWEVAAPECTAACGTPIEVARGELELRQPDHPPLSSIGEFEPDRSALCGPRICAVSGFLGIFVFNFSHSRSRPIIVSCPGILACRVGTGYGASTRVEL